MRILTQKKARALYAAMRNLNDIGANFRFTFYTDNAGRVTVEDDPETWEVRVLIKDGTIVETYESQLDFAQAYGVPT